MINIAAMISPDINFSKFGLEHYRFFDHLSMLPFIHKIILHGSRARGDYEDWSDIDLAIDCPGASASQWFDVEEIIDRADTLLDVQATRMDTINDEIFRNQINLYGQVIYDRS